MLLEGPKEKAKKKKKKVLAGARSKVLQLTASKENRDPSHTTTRNLISQQLTE